MQSITIAVLMVVVAAQPYCNSFVQAGSYYDISFGSKTDSQVNVPGVSANTSFTYNLCGSVSRICEVLTNGTAGTLVQNYEGTAILTINSSFCVPFTSDPVAGLNSNNDVNRGVQLVYTSEAVNGVTYTVNLISYCGVPTSINQVVGNTYTIGSGIDGCPKLDLTTLWDFFGRNTLAFFITTEVLGIILMVLGVYLYRVTLLVLGLLAAFFVLIMVESIVVFQPGVPIELTTSVIVITIVTSVLAGYVTLYFPRVGLFVMGMWVGFFLSFILNNIALYHIVSNPPALPLMITMGILGIGMGVLSLFIKKTFVIVSTCNQLFKSAFIGAYASIRALSWFLGKYPNQFLIAKEVHTQSLQVKVEWQYYIYVVALVILTLSSVAIQFWIFRKKSKMLGKKADIDSYIGKIEEDLDMERSKFINVENVFKKEDKKKPKAIFLKKKKADSDQDEQANSQNNGSDEQQQLPKNRQATKKNGQKNKKLTKTGKSNSEEESPASEQSDDDKDDEGADRQSSKRSSNREAEEEGALRERLLATNKRRK